MIKKIRSDFLILLLLSPFFAYGNNTYQMMPGKYSIKLSITDSEESYPVSLSFHLDEGENIRNGIIEYPTYDCKAVISSSSKQDLTITIYEKMMPGFDACSESYYEIKLNRELPFQPHQMKYITIDGGEDANIKHLKMETYTYIPTSYGYFRIENRVGSHDDIYHSENSNLIRKHIQLSSRPSSKKEASIRLNRLTELEKSEYFKIEESPEIQKFISYMRKYPGSSYISNSNTKIEQIKKGMLIAEFRGQSTAESFYQAHILSNNDVDIISLLQEFNNINDLQGFISNHERIKKHRLVINDLITYYRKRDSYRGYISAFSLSNRSNDIRKAYNSASSMAEKIEAETLLVRHIGIESIFKVQVASKSESEFKQAAEAGLVLSINASYRNIKRIISVSSNRNNGLPLQYGEYKVKVKFILDREFEPRLNDDDRDYITKTFVLNKNNGFETRKEIDFIVPVYGKVKAMGMGFIAGLLGSYVGQDISDDDVYIPFKLISTSLSSEIIGID